MQAVEGAVQQQPPSPRPPGPSQSPLVALNRGDASPVCENVLICPASQTAGLLPCSPGPAARTDGKHLVWVGVGHGWRACRHAFGGSAAGPAVRRAGGNAILPRWRPPTQQCICGMGWKQHCTGSVEQFWGMGTEGRHSRPYSRQQESRTVLPMEQLSCQSRARLEQAAALLLNSCTGDMPAN